MAYSREEIEQFYRRNAAKMEPLYRERPTIGRKMEIAWDGHAPVRVILNYPKNNRKEKYPVLINVHGGAFAEGDAVTMDSFCQRVADDLGILVVNLNYRLYPEVSYPYPVDEADQVCKELKAKAEEFHVDADNIAIGGFSAGATIAFGSEIRALQNGEEGYRCIFGCYPMTSGRHEDVEMDSPYAAAGGELGAAMDFAMEGWTEDPVCTSLLAGDDILRKIKGAVIVTCGKDSLGRMGRSFAARLAENGVKLFYQEFENAYHGFVEVNRPDFFLPDDRKNPEQAAYTEEAEKFMIDGLARMLEINQKE